MSRMSCWLGNGILCVRIHMLYVCTLICITVKEGASLKSDESERPCLCGRRRDEEVKRRGARREEEEKEKEEEVLLTSNE